MRLKNVLIAAAVTAAFGAAAPAVTAAEAPVRLNVGYADGSIEAVTVRPGLAESTLDRLAGEDGVTFAEVDHPVHAADTVPNDPQWPSQVGLQQLGMPKAWDRTVGDPTIVIAVIDSGVDAGVADLQGALVPGTDIVGHDADPNDENGHGTEVASVIAARANNGQGVAGYCWECKVMPIRVLDSNGAGSSGDVAAAIQYAVAHG